ncbi:helix-turn-helix transcriptional regulator [Blastococcus xanthinilyticus]|uniref:HTH domain-containing protein n=1 Tax=Blastococcus xanthinilyticus TaxID=1564164 RepID=A0A5S5CQF0_9ACTN|nr:WYL domain-containing protein [Blastococcus xanthinilyticus]TYP84575.1 HTH domain-containing protein [Blastococcus xanthinilyticus]
MSGTSSRLLTLLSLLQARRDWPGAALADRLQVSSRTVRRDVDRLRGLGYPVHAVKGPDGGYRLDAGSELPPLLFDDDQAVALAVALRVAAASGVGIEEAAARALATVRQVMPARLRHRIDAVQVAAAPSRSGGRALDPAVLLALSAAIRAREVLRFDHRPERPGDEGGEQAGPDVPPRRVEPHATVTWAGRWYLVGWDLDRDDWRIFRADRIAPRTPTGPRFAPRPLPGGDVASFVRGRFRGAVDGDAWPCSGVVELGLPAAEVAAFAHDGVVEALGPDRCRLTLGAWSWTGLAAAVVRFDCDIRVVGPVQLGEAFSTLSRRAAAAGGAHLGQVACSPLPTG